MADISAVAGPETLCLLEQLTVPTRLYFQSTTTSALTSLAFDAAWQETAAAIRRSLTTPGHAKDPGTHPDLQFIVTSSATTPELHLIGQFVSAPLRAQTIAGTIIGQIRAAESNTNFNGTIQIGVRVVSNDGLTVRATLLAVTGSTNTAASPPEIAVTTGTNRRFLNSSDVTPIALSSYTCIDGDRLVVEIGIRDVDSGATRTAFLQIGQSNTDLPENDTTTTAQCPWVQFDSIIQFQDAFEQLKIADTVTVDLPLQPGLLTETSKARDVVFGITRSVASQNARSAGLEENPLHISDTPTVILGVNLNAAVSDEPIKVQDQTPVPSLSAADLSRNVGDEVLKLADGGVATQQGIVQLLGVIHVQDQLTQPVLVSGDLSRQISPDESLKLADTVTVSENPVFAAPALESLIVQDSVTLFENPLFAAPTLESLKVQDTVTASMGGLFASGFDENLKVQDTVTLFENPLFAAPAVESLKIADDTPPQVSGLGNVLTVAVTAETLHLNDQPPFVEERLRVVDTVTAAIVTGADLSRNVGDESLKLKDGGVATQQGIVQLLGVIHVQDTVTAAIAGTLSRAIGDEVLHVQDTVAASLTVLLPSTGALTETLYLDDSGLVAAIGMDEVIHCVDQTPIATLTGGGNLSRQVADESLKVQDTILASMGDLVVLVTQESLKVQDTVTVSENPLFAAPALESLKVVDTVSVSENPLFASGFDELLHVQDTVTASMGGLFVSGIDESLKIQDTVSVLENELFAAPTLESLKVQDTVAVVENELIAAPTVESLKVQDQTVSASLGGLAVQISPDELLHIQDTLLASMGGLVTSTTENAKVQDTVTAQLDTLLVTVGSESLKVQDTVTPGLERSVTVTQESLKVQDSVSAILDLFVVVAAESCRVQDSTLSQLTVLRASASESLKVQDVLTIGVDLLTVTVTSELLHIQDFWVVLAVPDVTVHVRPVVGIIHVRPDSGSVRV